MDEHLARGLRDGRPDAWRALYDTFAERVWCFVARRVGPGAVADVVQETMLAAARSARTYDPAAGTLWHWLCGIARFQIALHFRKEQRFDRVKRADWLAAHADRLGRWLDGTEPPPPDPLEAAELTALVRATLAELPDEYEALLTAKYLDSEPVERIAAHTRSTETAVRSKLARARDAFRTAFARLTGDQPAPSPAGDGAKP